MKLYKEDILCIGDYPENTDGRLDLMAFFPCVNSDEILLREILLKFGDDYRIVEVICYEDVICFRTNLPYNAYNQAVKNYLVVNNRKRY